MPCPSMQHWGWPQCVGPSSFPRPLAGIFWLPPASLGQNLKQLRIFHRESISQRQLGSFHNKGTMMSFFRELKTPACCLGCGHTAWAVNSETCTWNTVLHLFWQLCFHTWFAELFCYIRGHLEYIFLLQKWYVFSGNYLNHQLLHCPCGILLLI